MSIDPWIGVAWVAGGYLVGAIPSTYLVARARGSGAVLRGAERERSEADAHILLKEHAGGGWAALAATIDVSKSFVYAVAAVRFGNLPVRWVAVVGVALVAGYCWPPFARWMAGRGLASAAGVYLAILPLAMVVAGVVTLIGVAIRMTPAASTLGFASVPAVAAIQGHPGPLVAMGVAIFAAIVLRRLEGIGDVVRSGIPWPSAVYNRIVHDASGPRTAGSTGEEPSPSG